ncbi:hypothetical protein MNV49_007248 [Pseudohyphozyma bogoriensis]|nr:hypothetical protein MNV49_007248 [Pseudohyphozyma bogoriensis]
MAPNGTTNGAGRTQSTDDEQEGAITDVAAFQAQLDDSVSSVKALVQSWIPTDLDSSWDAPSSSSNVNVLNQRARPARMGLGANPSAIHKQQAEDKKLRDQLLRSTKAGASAAATADDKLVNGKGKATEADDNSDEEESRAGAIKKTAAPNPFRDPPATVLPSILAPSKSATPSAQPSPSASDDKPMSKNKRKKLREREKEESSKKARLDAVRAEEAAARKGGLVNYSSSDAEGDVEMASTPDVEEKDEPAPSSSPKKLPRSLVQVPFAPLTSSSEGEEAPAKKAQSDDEEGSGDEEGESSTKASPLAGGQANGGAGGEGKKKKRRKKKTKKGKGAGDTEPVPVLNLGTPVKH